MRCSSLPRLAAFLWLAFSAVIPGASQGQSPSATVVDLLGGLREQSKVLEATSGMREAFRSFTAANRLPPDAVRYSDFVIVRLLFEATRDAGLWNVHWTITDRPPVSDSIWRQWQAVQAVSAAKPTAAAECDEISALFAFLSRSLGVRGIGLLWPYANHTVAVWELHPKSRPAVRVVIPTTQIFLGEADRFGTRKFDPWRQPKIYEYTRRDVPVAFALPRALLRTFLRQAGRYGGAGDATLQQLRYLRDGVLLRQLTPAQAAVEADRRSRAVALAAAPSEDVEAFASFAEDMRTAR